MPHQNAPEDTLVAERLAEPAPRRAQIPMASHIDADVEAIRELRERIKDLRGNLATAVPGGARHPPLPERKKSPQTP